MSGAFEAIKSFRSRYFVSVYLDHKAKRQDADFFAFLQISVELSMVLIGIFCGALLLLDSVSVLPAEESKEVFSHWQFKILAVFVVLAAFFGLFGWGSTRKRIARDEQIRALAWSGWKLHLIGVSSFLFGGLMFLAYLFLGILQDG